MSKYCFVSDAESIFKLVKIVDAGRNGKITVVDADPKKQGAPLSVNEKDCVLVESIEELENPPNDLIKLRNVHQATILHTLRSRYFQDRIYTSIGPILIALNPFKWIPGIYDETVKASYQSGHWNLSDNPHVFAIAHDSYADMLSKGSNQSVIIR